MSKTNNESMQPEVQVPENQAGGGLKLDVTVRPIAPMGNLLAYANVTPAAVPWGRRTPWSSGWRTDTPMERGKAESLFYISTCADW